MSRLEITVDAEFNNKAALLLNDIWDDVCLHPQKYGDCTIKGAIDYVLVKTCTKTWPYILMTQLLGKATDDGLTFSPCTRTVHSTALGMQGVSVSM